MSDNPIVYSAKNGIYKGTQYCRVTVTNTDERIKTNNGKYKAPLIIIDISSGKDNTWNTADDTIFIQGNIGTDKGKISRLNKEAIQQAIDFAKTGNNGTKEITYNAKTPTFEVTPTKDKVKLTEWIDNNILNISGQTIDKEKLLELGFDNDEAYFLQSFMSSDSKFEFEKQLIRKGLNKLFTETDKDKKTALKEAIYSYARVTERGNADTAESAEVISIVKDRLDYWTSQADQQEIEEKIAKLTSKNVCHFIQNFKWDDMDIFESLYYDCQDDDNVCLNTYKSMYYALKARMEELGQTKESAPKTYKNMELAYAAISTMENNNGGFCWTGEWDYRIKDAAEKLKDFANGVIWHEEYDPRVKNRSKNDTEKALRNLVQ